MKTTITKLGILPHQIQFRVQWSCGATAAGVPLFDHRFFKTLAAAKKCAAKHDAGTPADGTPGPKSLSSLFKF